MVIPCQYYFQLEYLWFDLFMSWTEYRNFTIIEIEKIVTIKFKKLIEEKDNLDDSKYFKNHIEESEQNILISKLENIGCNVLFLPEVQEIYPKGLAKKKIVNNFRNILCDKFRPGHFDGVTTVVDLFFNMIKPTNSYFGEKDFQQVKIIQDLVKINHHNIKIIQCPSVRDKIGMSLSSRNSKFSNDQLKIFDELGNKIKEHINLLKQNEINNLDQLKIEFLQNNINKIDYLEIRNENNLEITNKYFFKDGRDYQNYRYDISEAIIDDVVYPSLDPCIFEVRYPENDIVGTARQ